MGDDRHRQSSGPTAVSSEDPSLTTTTLGKVAGGPDDVADDTRLVVGRHDHERLADQFVEVLGGIAVR